jgi:MFS family permease
LIDTSFGAGALIGAVIAPRLVASRSVERPWVVVGMLGVAVGWAIIALTPWFALVLVGSFVAASLDSVGNVAGYGIVQRHAPDAVRGRVIGAQVTAGLGANMVGFVVVGPLVEALGPQTVYGLGAVLSLIAAATFAIPTSREPTDSSQRLQASG